MSTEILRNVGYYLASAQPWLSSSIVVPALSSGGITEISFPFVSRLLVIRNLTSPQLSSADVKVGMSSAGVRGTNYITLANGEGIEMPWKATKVFVLASGPAGLIEVAAGLTDLPSSLLAGNWTGSSGIG